jgi:hypothetical protein
MGLEYLDNVVVHRDFITQAERTILHDFAIDKFNDGFFVPDKYDYEPTKENIEAANKPLRHTYEIHWVDAFNGDPIVKVLTTRIMGTMQIHQFKSFAIDPLLGWLIAIIQPGGFIQTHIDPYDRAERLPPRFKHHRHIRFNVMVNRGDHISYSPHIRKKVLDINPCDAWCFPPDKLVHSLPHIQGTEPRIVYQFGFAIDPTLKE